MDSNYVQNLRYKLQKRVRKLNSSGFRTFHSALVRFWGFLDSQVIFHGVLDYLANCSQDAESDADKVLKGEALVSDSEIEEAALAYHVLNRCRLEERNDIEFQIGHKYGPGGKHDEALEHFRDVFVEPLYEYIDEQLDDQRAILALLRKYKQKCEWFQRERLLDLYNEAKENRKGEKVLSSHLYEYLHDQGLEFSIEPTSVSGEADLVATQNTDDPLIADVKIFDPKKSKEVPYIVKGFHQVYQYTLDFNEPFGYLVIFKTCREDLAISVTKQEQAIPFVVHNNKTIFILVIDLFAHEKSASQRGKLKSHVVTEDGLVHLQPTAADDKETE